MCRRAHYHRYSKEWRHNCSLRSLIMRNHTLACTSITPLLKGLRVTFVKRKGACRIYPKEARLLILMGSRSYSKIRFSFRFTIKDKKTQVRENTSPLPQSSKNLCTIFLTWEKTISHSTRSSKRRINLRRILKRFSRSRWHMSPSETSRVK